MNLINQSLKKKLPDDPKTTTLELSPAYLNGELHAGHLLEQIYLYVLNRALKLRPKLQNTGSFRLALGTDANGLPTVQKAKLEKPGLVGEPLKAEILKLLDYYEKKNQKQFELVGLKKEDNYITYRTDSSEFYSLASKFLEKCVSSGRLCSALIPYTYCTSCKTTIPAEDTDYRVVKKQNYSVSLTVDNITLNAETTRPQLMPWVRVVNYNPNDIRYKHLNGKLAHLQVDDKKISVPCLPSKWIVATRGTGLVLTAQYGSKIDVEVIRQCRLDLERLEQHYGLIYRGSYDWDKIKTADRPKLVAEAKGQTSSKILIHAERRDCLGLVEFKVTDQVIIRLTAKDLTAITKRAEAVLCSFQSQDLQQLKKLIQNLSDWVISRDLDNYYSYAFLDKNCAVDTWVLSGLTTVFCGPNTIRFHGRDIARSWLLNTLIVEHILEKPSLDRVILHGFVCDKNLKKMSKSAGNGLTCTQLLKRPLPALRAAMLDTDLYHNFAFTTEKIDLWQRTHYKLRSLEECITKLEVGHVDTVYNMEGHSFGTDLLQRFDQDLATFCKGGPPPKWTYYLGAIREQIYFISRSIIGKKRLFSIADYNQLKLDLDCCRRFLGIFE